MERDGKVRFLGHGQMDFEVRAMLGACHRGGADAGEVLAAVEQIPDGDCEGWYRAWTSVAERVLGYAEESRAAGRRVGARESYLRAANYFAASTAMVDGTSDPGRGAGAWRRHRDCWNAFCALLDPPAEQVSIPYEAGPMPGHLFCPDGTGGPFATVIFNNGSDGPTSAMWHFGVAGALGRGYAALVFDGPGQNAMLFERSVPFRPDWEKVVTPVVDFLLTRPEVDGSRIALSGLSQGGYWALRALAFEHRIAAGILDPGVIDVFASYAQNFPPELLQLLDEGPEEVFDAAMEEGLKAAGEATRQNVRWRMKPYCTESYYRWLRCARSHDARDVAGLVRCPVFVADPDGEQFWPGQSREVFEALTCPKTLVRFTREEGADLHCEPMARALYDRRMLDWLEGVMPVRT